MLKDVAGWGVMHTVPMSTRRPISGNVCMYSSTPDGGRLVRVYNHLVLIYVVKC